jgi:3',5'-cyclic-AMP phosphodiesterase
MVLVAQLSDLHLSRNAGDSPYGCDPDARLAHALSAAAELEPDLILLTGDVGSKVVWLPGNHDDLRRMVDVRPDWSRSEVVLGDWRVLCLDSRREGEVSGWLGSERLAALRSELLDDDAWTAIALHHPPQIDCYEPQCTLADAAAFMRVITEFPKVRVVVSGHAHAAFQYRLPWGLQLLGCPSTCTAISHDREHRIEEGGRGFRWLKLCDDGSLLSDICAT